MFDDLTLNKAKTILGLNDISDENLVKKAYHSKLYQYNFSSKENANSFLNDLNSAFEIIMNYGMYCSSRHDMLKFLIFVPLDDGTVWTEKKTRPIFYHNCWDPYVLPFSSYESLYLSRSFSSRAIRYEEMKKYFLPYRCLCKLLYLKKHHLSVKNNLAETKALCFFTCPKSISETICVDLVRTMRRSNNIDIQTVGEQVSWKVTQENERYPYSIALFSRDNLCLGELPNDFSACLTPLLEAGFIKITATINYIDCRRDRGRYAKCSHIGIDLKIQTLNDMAVEVYFAQP